MAQEIAESYIVKSLQVLLESNYQAISVRCLFELSELSIHSKLIKSTYQNEQVKLDGPEINFAEFYKIVARTLPHDGKIIASFLKIFTVPFSQIFLSLAKMQHR